MSESNAAEASREPGTDSAAGGRFSASAPVGNAAPAEVEAVGRLLTPAAARTSL
ncbi:hypothetical protein [Nocardia fluminea]|uniref:hypothetical protein n=1 Tax=Nocardia fluminea TaxID=134984 RepID=UPI0033D46565